jgi:hypothetical protein
VTCRPLRGAVTRRRSHRDRRCSAATTPINRQIRSKRMAIDRPQKRADNSGPVPVCVTPDRGRSTMARGARPGAGDGERNLASCRDEHPAARRCALGSRGYEVTHPADPAPAPGHGAFPRPNTPKNPCKFDVGCVSTEPANSGQIPCKSIASGLWLALASHARGRWSEPTRAHSSVQSSRYKSPRPRRAPQTVGAPWR